jgi:hypothetical protein
MTHVFCFCNVHSKTDLRKQYPDHGHHVHGKNKIRHSILLLCLKEKIYSMTQFLIAREKQHYCQPHYLTAFVDDILVLIKSLERTLYEQIERELRARLRCQDRDL